MENPNTFGWNFPQSYTFTPLKGTSDRTFDSVQSLTREAIQNCLGAQKDNSAPINIFIHKTSVKTTTLPFIGDFQKHLEGALELHKKNPTTGNITNPTESLENAISLLKEEYIPCLLICDTNTVGLEGNHGVAQGRLFRFLQGEGVSEDVGESAGSHGLGKQAFIASSDIGCFLFYSKTEEYPNGFFSGRCNIGMHKNPDGGKNDRALSGEGFIASKIEESSGIPCMVPIYSEDIEVPRDLQVKEKTGTNILVPAFTSDPNWIHQAAREALEGFTLAIHNGKLNISLEDKESNEKIDITKCNLVEALNSNIDKCLEAREENYANKTQIKQSRLGTSRGMLKALNADKNIYEFIERLDIIGETKAVIIYDPQDEELNNRCFVLRLAEMNIFDMGSKIIQDWGGYVQCTSKQGNNIIKNLEDPQHKGFRDPTKIRNKGHISTSDYKKVNGIIRTFVQKCLRSLQPKISSTGEFEGLNRVLYAQSGTFSQGSAKEEDFNAPQKNEDGVSLATRDDAIWGQRPKEGSNNGLDMRANAVDTGNEGTKSGRRRVKSKRSQGARPRQGSNTQTGIPSPEPSQGENTSRSLSIRDIQYKLFELESDTNDIGINILPRTSGILSFSLLVAGEKTNDGDNDTNLDLGEIIDEAEMNGTKPEVNGCTISGIVCKGGAQQMLRIRLKTTKKWAFTLA